MNNGQQQIDGQQADDKLYGQVCVRKKYIVIEDQTNLNLNPHTSYTKVSLDDPSSLKDGEDKENMPITLSKVSRQCTS